MSNEPEREQNAPPFPRHRTYYMILKWAVIAVALYLLYRYFSGQLI